MGSLLVWKALPHAERSSLIIFTTKEYCLKACLRPVSRQAWRRHKGVKGQLTSAFATLLHAVLVDVQSEEHMGVAVILLIAVSLAAATWSDGSIEEEGSLLCCRGTELTLILKLQLTQERNYLEIPTQVNTTRQLLTVNAHCGYTGFWWDQKRGGAWWNETLLTAAVAIPCPPGCPTVESRLLKVLTWGTTRGSCYT